MITIAKSITITATSIVEDNEQDMVVAHMNANIGDDGNINISKSTINKDIFDKHKTQVLADFKEFEEYVYSMQN